jgi:hypothetical protein
MPAADARTDVEYAAAAVPARPRVTAVAPGAEIVIGRKPVVSERKKVVLVPSVAPIVRPTTAAAAPFVARLLSDVPKKRSNVSPKRWPA